MIKILTPIVSKQTVKLFNEQITQENQSSAEYLAMAIWADLQGYHGASYFLRKSADEERKHMLKFIAYLLEIGAEPILPATKSINPNYSSLHAIFVAILQRERNVTSAIHKLVEHAQTNKDYRTYHFLQWFVAEQREEELKSQRALELFTLIGKDGMALFMVDQEIKN
jgi:ferritin